MGLGKPDDQDQTLTDSLKVITLTFKNILAQTLILESPRLVIFEKKMFLGLAECVCMYVCLFDSSQTAQPRALKLWHTIPRVK